MIYPELQKIGLTPKEVEVYQILLRRGESPVGDILKETGDHPQLIYRAIDGLEATGLAIITYRRHRKYVQAEDPRALINIEEDRLNKLRTIIPQLVELQKTGEEPTIRVAKGNEAVRKIRAQAIEELKEGEVYYVIGASGDKFYQTMGEQLLEIERKRTKKGIWRKMITFENQRGLISENDRFNKNLEVRYLAENYSVPSTTIIFGHTVGIQIWSNIPVVISIESKEVAESYLHNFNALWKIAVV